MEALDATKTAFKWHLSSYYIWKSHLAHVCPLVVPWWQRQSPSPPAASVWSSGESASPRPPPLGQYHLQAKHTNTHMFRSHTLFGRRLYILNFKQHAVADLVVDVAVCEHGVEVLDTLLGIPVVVVLQAFFYRAHVHRGLDDLIVVLQEDREQY